MLLCYLSNAQNITYINTKDLQQLKSNTSDTLYIINFWATWCKPCVEELPEFEKITANYADKKVKVILISNDFSKQVETRLKPFIKQNNITSTVYFLNEKTPDIWMPIINKDWEGNIPATLFVKGSKKFMHFIAQQLTYDDICLIIKNNINE